jgi:hypothetical protein
MQSPSPWKAAPLCDAVAALAALGHKPSKRFELMHAFERSLQKDRLTRGQVRSSTESCFVLQSKE